MDFPKIVEALENGSEPSDNIFTHFFERTLKIFSLPFSVSVEIVGLTSIYIIPVLLLVGLGGDIGLLFSIISFYFLAVIGTGFIALPVLLRLTDIEGKGEKDLEDRSNETNRVLVIYPILIAYSILLALLLQWTSIPYISYYASLFYSLIDFMVLYLIKKSPLSITLYLISWWTSGPWFSDDYGVPKKMLEMIRFPR